MNDTIEGEYALAVIEPAKSAIANWTPRFVMPIAEMVQASDDMTTFQRRIMVKEIHYGTIPGTDKPTLLKAGAELLLSRMGLHAADPTILSETIDYGDSDVEGNITREGLIRFSLQVNIYHQTGALENERILVGSGIGAATSREKKYRWRDGSPTCPDCGKGLRMSKNKPEWYCWAKMGGCSATFPKGDFQQVGRVPNPELGDLENTIFKMAKKRALIDATLVATGCSNVFTQDVGDDSEGDLDPNDVADAAAAATAAKGAGRRSQPVTVPRVPQDELLALAHAHGIDGLKALGAWCVEVGIAPDLLSRERKMLTNEETQAAKARLEIPPVKNAQNAATQPRGEAQALDDGSKVTPRTNGRLFALLDERLGRDKPARLTFAAEHGIIVDSFSALTELQARTLIRALELIRPPEDPDDALLDYAEGKLF